MIDAYRYLVNPNVRRLFAFGCGERLTGYVVSATHQWVVIEKACPAWLNQDGSGPANVNMDNVLFHQESPLL